MEQRTKKNSKSIYYIILILVLFASNGIFIYNYFTTDKKLVHTEETLYATDSVKAELEKVLGQTMDELGLYKGKNAQLDAFLKEKSDSLQEYAERIEVLLKTNRLNKSRLDSVLEELDQLRYYKRKYLNQIDSLSNQIAMLNQENSTLKTTIDKERRKNEDLLMNNTRLSNKVAIGAKLSATGIFATGGRMRSNGKERETNRASQIEQLKFTFKIDENYVTDAGDKDIYLKIIGPEGSTLYNEAAGSGTFKFQGEEALYTTKKTIEFTQQTQNVAVYWTKGSDFVKGKYKAELFCEGLIIGVNEFELK